MPWSRWNNNPECSLFKQHGRMIPTTNDNEMVTYQPVVGHFSSWVACKWLRSKRPHSNKLVFGERRRINTSHNGNDTSVSDNIVDQCWCTNKVFFPVVDRLDSILHILTCFFFKLFVAHTFSSCYTYIVNRVILFTHKQQNMSRIRTHKKDTWRRCWSIFPNEMGHYQSDFDDE